MDKQVWYLNLTTGETKTGYSQTIALENPELWTRISFEEYRKREYATVSTPGERGEYEARQETDSDVGGFIRPCENCKGSGTFMSVLGYLMTCPDCDGTGIYSEGKDLSDDELFLQSLAQRDADVVRLEAEIKSLTTLSDMRQTAMERLQAENARLTRELKAAKAFVLAVDNLDVNDLDSVMALRAARQALATEGERE